MDDDISRVVDNAFEDLQSSGNYKLVEAAKKHKAYVAAVSDGVNQYVLIDFDVSMYPICESREEYMSHAADVILEFADFKSYNS